MRDAHKVLPGDHLSNGDLFLEVKTMYGKAVQCSEDEFAYHLKEAEVKRLASKVVDLISTHTVQPRAWGY